ncbi:MAG: hypothetical protein ACP5E3_18055 [Bacteroidales bacterium]
MLKNFIIIFSFLNLVIHLNVSELSFPGVDSSDIFINGWEYRMVPARSGHPFVFSKVWQFEEINSDLGVRNDYLMNYDVYQDELVIQTFFQGSPAQIVLNPANIRSFKIEEHHFINPQKLPDLAETGLKGYYEIIYEGNLKFFIKHIKQISDEGSMKGRAYESKIDYFIFLDDNLYSIKNKRSLLKIFPEYKKEISRYMRDQQILINSASVLSLKALMNYVDQLVTN